MSRGLGILATALAGGAGAIGSQAAGDIEQQRKTDLMREQAGIEEQMRMRLAEFNERLRQQGVVADNTGPVADAKLEYAGREGKQRTQQAVDQARSLIPVTQEAARASADTERDVTKAKAADKDYLRSAEVLALADPEKRARIQSTLASAGASAAQTRLAGEQLKQLQQVGAVATKVRDLQGQLASAATPDQRETIQRQIADLGFTGKDTKGFMAIAERAMSNADAALKVLNDPAATDDAKKTALAQLQRANQFADQAAAQAGIKVGGASGSPYPDGTELRGKDGKLYVVRDGQPMLKAGGSSQPAAKARTGMLSTPSLDMDGITFSGDGYKVGGQTYPTLSEAQAARDKSKLSNNPMSQSLGRYGDD